MGDWKNFYTTYDKSYIKTQFCQFFKLYKKNLIFRDYKPIYWSPSSRQVHFYDTSNVKLVFFYRTALAEAELEYNENHKSPSAFVRFQVKNIPRVPSFENKM